MTEIIDEVKKQLANNKWNATCVEPYKTWLSSLITTIESQTEKLEKLKLHAEHLQALVNGQDQSHTEYVNETETLIEQKDTLIESQKEEIRRRVIQAEINIGLGETVINMQAEIESLKAITELAVKGLKEIAKGDDAYHTTIFEAKDWIDKIEAIANTTLFEIGRLSK